MLRSAFFMELEDGMLDVQSELQRLEERRSCADPELFDVLVAQKPILLRVALDQPFPEAEAAYDRRVERIMSVRTRAPEPG